MDSPGHGHRLKTIRSTITLGGILGGFVGSTIQKTGKCGQTAEPIGTQFCTYNADESGNGHIINEIHTITYKQTICPQTESGCSWVENMQIQQDMRKITFGYK